MAEVNENMNNHRWDAGAGTTALGIIGTALGGLATVAATHNTAQNVQDSESRYVDRHELSLHETIAQKDSQIALLTSQSYTDKNTADLRYELHREVDSLRAEMNGAISAQAVINANNQSALGILTTQANSLAAQLAAITKTAVPASVVTDFTSAIPTRAANQASGS